MSTTCTACNGTGETGHYGIIDCQAPGCTAATERAALKVAMDGAGALTQYDRDWHAYNLGKAAAKKEKQDGR